MADRTHSSEKVVNPYEPSDVKADGVVHGVAKDRLEFSRKESLVFFSLPVITILAYLVISGGHGGWAAIGILPFLLPCHLLSVLAASVSFTVTTPNQSIFGRFVVWIGGSILFLYFPLLILLQMLPVTSDGP